MSEELPADATGRWATARARAMRLFQRLGGLSLHALRIALGGVFAFAGFRKAFATQDFARDIQHYALLSSPTLIIFIAVYLPWVELAAGLALLTRRLQLGALALIAGLMLVFTGALTSAWWRGLDITCGCFSEERVSIRRDYPELLARDLALLLSAVLLLRFELRSRATPAVEKPPADPKAF